MNQQSRLLLGVRAGFEQMQVIHIDVTFTPKDKRWEHPKYPLMKNKQKEGYSDNCCKH